MLVLQLEDYELELILLALNQYEPKSGLENDDTDKLIEKLEDIQDKRG